MKNVTIAELESKYPIIVSISVDPTLDYIESPTEKPVRYGFWISSNIVSNIRNQKWTYFTDGFENEMMQWPAITTLDELEDEIINFFSSLQQ